MTAYIGTATSRVDGRAKVTGEAKYAAEFNANDLAYGSIIESTIAKGRIVRIDTVEALRVEGVLDVLTHENRPRMAHTDKAWKDDVAPEEGSPFRPLYDDNIKFSGQPIALVLAEEWEIARYAASLVRIEYEEQAFVTDLYKQRDQAFVVEKPDKPHGDAGRAFIAAEVRHEAEYFIPTEHHNPMELFASTAIWDGDGKLTVYDKTQGVQNVQRYLCSVFEKKPDEVRVMSPYRRRRIWFRAPSAIPGSAGDAGSAGAAAIGTARADAPADVWARLPAGDHRAACARRQSRWNARLRYPRGDRRHLAIRRVLPQRHRLGSAALQVRQREIRTPAGAARRSHLLRHARARRCDWCVCPRERDGRARRSAEARSDRASAALLFGSRPERGRALHQQAAARMLSPGRRSLRLG